MDYFSIYSCKPDGLVDVTPLARRKQIVKHVQVPMRLHGIKMEGAKNLIIIQLTCHKLNHRFDIVFHHPKQKKLVQFAHAIHRKNKRWKEVEGST